jgi:hypothetical protein
MGPLTKDASAAFAKNHGECDGSKHERPVLGWGTETIRARSTGLVVESGYPKVDRDAALLALSSGRARYGTFKACACRLKQPFFDWTCLAFVMLPTLCARTQFSIQISCKPPHENAKNPIRSFNVYSQPVSSCSSHLCAQLRYPILILGQEPDAVLHLQHSASTARCPAHITFVHYLPSRTTTLPLAAS